ncbi:probable receptor-like protein kinase At1g80640 [Cryptomeria japonica]|uniref:probable receptor-like protein kinase At1g80640 n=1 Tax=Cryptomeria japonica TaxID=3369 RepID=UPI0027D9EDE1|nr:probable receptor-like protein kinase At1g80640 [Cryptomeria japonica]XP_057858866.2 probable receptor-like protein kinase At1g80640 [Cryptomeria japonica]XP_057858867.2 probable receptor-like protein kinase At1g80640 [Cryptomeria japonica]
MGYLVLLDIVVLCLCASANFEVVKGRTFLSPTSAPVSLWAPKQAPLPPPSSGAVQATGNAESRPEKSMEGSPAPTEILEESHHTTNVILLIIIIVPAVVGLIMISSIFIWMCIKARSSASSSQAKALGRNADPDISDAYKSMALGPLMNRFNSLRVSKRKGFATPIEYSILQAATNNFSSDNIIGEGGFGCVYKARFDDDSFAAVKKLDEGSKQAEHEFQNEVELMSKIRHPNLVSLLGFCTQEKTRLLVYELMQNGSLEDQLHGPLRGSALTWYLRMKIALDSARGLEHLHEHCHPSVIHRDFKSSNILLDASFNAKLSDFGLSITADGCAGHNVELLGTFGYVAPEYLLEGRLTEKSDVYAFGVVLLELLIGKRPIDKSEPQEYQSLVSWAMPQLRDRNKLPSIVDPVIKDTMNLKHLYQVAAIAVLCVQPEPSYRPLIADVVHSLIPLVPVELGGTLRVADAPNAVEMKTFDSSHSSTITAMNSKL